MEGEKNRSNGCLKSKLLGGGGGPPFQAKKKIIHANKLGESPSVFGTSTKGLFEISFKNHALLQSTPDPTYIYIFIFLSILYYFFFYFFSFYIK